MSKTMKKVSALLLALLMIVTFMPMTQGTVYAAAKKPAKVKGLKVKVKGNKLKISWKKAKNAKKYIVKIKDNKTKLTATKTTKKKKITVKAQYSTKYTISVQGLNGKVKGKASKKVKKTTGEDPSKKQTEEDLKKAEEAVIIAQAAEKQAKDEAAAAKEEASKAETEKEAAEAAAAQAAADAAAAKQAQTAAEAAAAQAEADKEAAEAAQAAAEQAQAAAEMQAELYKAAAEIMAELAEKTAKTDAEATIKAAAYNEYAEELEKAKTTYKLLDDMEREQLADSEELTLSTWNPEVKAALNDMIEANAAKDEQNYVVFDFDNTCSIFDVEEQLAVYQLQKMAFAESMDVDKLEDVLWTGLNAAGDPDLEDEYEDWIYDICQAYGFLLETEWAEHEDGAYFTPEGLDDDDAAAIQETPEWNEFATKMRAMYDLVFDAESADVAYPWVLYWFTGMTHEEVYNLAYASHDYYRAVATTEETWSTPASYVPSQHRRARRSRVGAVDYTWTSGTNVSQNIVELMAALDNAGIDVWVCSASATDPIRAAIDVWGLHDHVTGLMAMTNVYDGVFENEYDYAYGYAWLPTEDGWEEADGLNATEAQTQGKGKVVAVQNVCGPEYGKGPIAGFMDSTGDFNFCTEFKDLEVVCCFNRASRKVTDGGGLVAEVAVYEADTLGYDYAAAQEEDDVLYVLQGRDETGLRDLLNTTDEDGENQGRVTLRYGKDAPLLFRDEYNYAELEYFTNKKLSIKDIMDTYSLSTEADDPDNKLGFKYGFLKKYDGYKSQTGDIMDGLDPKLERDDWNPEVKEALNKMILANRGLDDKYVVFDFDNTCSIFDVEEQLAVYQLQRMAFAEDLDEDGLRDMLAEGLDFEEYGEEYEAWIDDIAYAYNRLCASEFATDGHFTPAGLSDEDSDAIQLTDDWKEFATKMRAMYDLVGNNESVAVSYPWVLYWFTGMSHDEVYDLAYASHSLYKDVPSEYQTWVSPSDYVHKVIVPGSVEDEPTEAGVQEVTFTFGTAVSDNIRELMKALAENDIDVWVCSASAIDPIRAAIDVWGLHDYVSGLMAMTTNYDEDAGKFELGYDYEGHEWYPLWADELNPEDEPIWIEGNHETGAQTQGYGKTDAIRAVCGDIYDGAGPIAGFMDSTGDFNFCTEFRDLEVVCCFNRASRKVTDGGGLVAEVACYEADELDYNYAKAKANGDTLYVLQGRDENGLRSLLPYRQTLRLDAEELKLFANDQNWEQLDYFADNELSVRYIMNTFCIKMAADDRNNPFSFKIGFLPEEQWRGYHHYPALDN